MADRVGNDKSAVCCSDFTLFSLRLPVGLCRRNWEFLAVILEDCKPSSRQCAEGMLLHCHGTHTRLSVSDMREASVHRGQSLAPTSSGKTLSQGGGVFNEPSMWIILVYLFCHSERRLWQCH